MVDRFETDRVVGGLCYPEAPRWHDGKIWLSDQYDHTIVAVDRPVTPMWWPGSTTHRPGWDGSKTAPSSLS